MKKKKAEENRWQPRHCQKHWNYINTHTKQRESKQRFPHQRDCQYDKLFGLSKVEIKQTVTDSNANFFREENQMLEATIEKNTIFAAQNIYKYLFFCQFFAIFLFKE